MRQTRQPVKYYSKSHAFGGLAHTTMIVFWRLRLTCVNHPDSADRFRQIGLDQNHVEPNRLHITCRNEGNNQPTSAAHTSGPMGDA